MAHSKASKSRNTHSDYVKNNYETNPRKHNGYTRIFRDLYFSPAYKTLTPIAKDVFTGLLLISKGNSPFKATFKDLEGRCSSSSFTSAVNQLVEHGILKAEQRNCYDYYTFTMVRGWVDYQPVEKKKKVNTKSLANLRKGTGNRPP